VSDYFDPRRLVFGIPVGLFYFIFIASFIPFILSPNAAIGVWILTFLFLYACVRHAMDEHPKEVARFDEEIANGRPRL
jgi:hypothetical protein